MHPKRIAMDFSPRRLRFGENADSLAAQALLGRLAFLSRVNATDLELRV